MTFDEFQATRRFDCLQQLRTISVLMVLAYHLDDPMWAHLRLFLGVQIFFVVSGFIITTLLVREEAREGRTSLSGFYLRRAFRILPVYYLALLLFAVPIIGAGLGGERPQFLHALPYYLTYQNELAPNAPFEHTWSLAVEEKFYLVWPLLLLVLPLTRRFRLPVALVLLAAGAACQVAGVSYPALYLSILTGCVVALVLHSPRGYAATAALRRTDVTVVLVVLAVASMAFESNAAGHGVFSVLVAAALPGLLTARGWLRRASTVGWLVRLGTYTYSFYLLHPLVKSVVDVAIAPGSSDPVRELGRFVVVAVLTFVASVVVYRVVERPMIALGHRLSSRPQAPGGVHHAVAATNARL